MDNRIFNVNGLTLPMLEMAIKLWCSNDGFTSREQSTTFKFEGYKIDLKKGFIFLRHIEGAKNAVKMPTPTTLGVLCAIAFDWLKSEEAKKVPLTGWDRDAVHDGSNDLGWRVFCEEWGFIQSEGQNLQFAVCVTPAYIWYGK